MKVLKFGGSVLKDGRDLENIANIISKSFKKTDFIVVVVSAFYGITNALVELTKSASSGKNYTKQFKKIYDFHIRLLKEIGTNDVENEIKGLFTNLDHILVIVKDAGKCGSEVFDAVLSFGERLSSLIVAKYLLKNYQTLAVLHISSQDIIKTDSNFGYARVDIAKTEQIIKNFFNTKKKKNIFVCAGFIGSDSEGRITTLGRNGSDYTASIIASALCAESVEIWKDIDGLCTADPKIVKNAKFIDKISYQEMAELSSLGNKVIHINAIFPCITKKIPIFLKNCYNQKCVGTKISADKNKICKINGVVKLDNVVILKMKMNEFADVKSIAIKTQKIVQKFDNAIITISQNIKQKIYSMIVVSNDVDFIVNNMNEELADFIDNDDILIKVSDKKSIISVIGSGISNAVGIAGRIFDTIQKNHISINAIHDDFSETRISFLCDVKDANKVIKVLHKKLVG